MKEHVNKFFIMGLKQGIISISRMRQVWISSMLHGDSEKNEISVEH